MRKLMGDELMRAEVLRACLPQYGGIPPGVKDRIGAFRDRGGDLFITDRCTHEGCRLSSKGCIK